jgi:hypothetical protein
MLGPGASEDEIPQSAAGSSGMSHERGYLQKSLNRFGASAVQTAVLVIE